MKYQMMNDARRELPEAALRELLNRCLKYLVLLLGFCLVLLDANSQSKYYWVGNSGNWNDLGKWSSVSGGSGFSFTKPPTEKDTVIFDQNSFTTTGRRVNINVSAACATMDWSNAITARSGSGASGPGIILNFALSVTTKLQLHPSMQGMSGSGSITCGSANGGNTEVNFNGIFVGASGGVIFFSNGGTINLRGDLVADWTWTYFRGGQINTNGHRLFVRNIVSDGSTARTINLGSSSISTQRLELGGASATHVFNAGTSVIELRNVSANHNWISIGAGIALNEVRLTRGDAWPIASGAGCSIKRLQIDENTSMRGPILIREYLGLAPGKTLNVVDNGLTMGAGSNLNLVGDCISRPYLLSSTGNPARVNLVSASTNISNAVLENINMVSPVRVNAINSVDLGGNTNIDFSASTASRTFYWRTGSGFWNDVNRWSFSNSGGAVAGCIPGPNDDVIFDNNAFTGGADTVKISGLVFARNVDFSTANGTPVIYGGLPFRYDYGFSYYLPYSSTTSFTINGNLTLSRNVKLDLNQTVKFIGAGSHTITSAGNGFGHNVVFAGRGTYTLTDSLWVRGSSAGPNITTSGGLFINSGGFVSAGNKVIARSFYSNTSTPRSINLGNSELLLNEKEGASDYWNTLDIRNNPTLNLSSATIRIRSEGMNRVQFILDVATRVGTLIVEDTTVFPTSASRIYFRDGSTVDRLRIMSNMTIQGSFTINEFLALKEGSYKFQPGKTITFDPNATLDNISSNVDCQSFINLDVDGAGTYTFRKASGVLSVSNAVIGSNIATGGATFNAINGVLTNSTGWQSTSAMGRTLFWVGDGGNWTDRSHWSLSSGGAGGQCVPSALDSVIFDQNSFSLTNQVVSFQNGNYSFRGLNAGSVNRNATFSGSSAVNIVNAGSMVLSSMANWQIAGTFAFAGSSNHIVDINSSFQARNIDFNGVGSYTIVSTLLATSSTIGLNRGTLTLMPGRTLSITSFISNINATRRFVMNDATLITQGDLRTPFQVAGTGFTYDFSKSNYILRNSGGWFPRIECSGLKFARMVMEGRALEITAPVTFDVLDFRPALSGSRIVFSGNMTILDSIMFKPGADYIFAAGSTLTIVDTADILANGISTAYTSFNSSINGSQFTINKQKNPNDPSKAQLCVEYVSVGNTRIATGPNNTVFKTNTESRDLGNNSGWFVSVAGTAGSGSIKLLGGMCKGSITVPLEITITQGSYPLDVVVRNLTTGKNDTVKAITGNGFPVTFNLALTRPNVTSIYRLEQIGVYRCDQILPSISGPFNEVTYTVYSGGSGVWTNHSGNSNWDECTNWGDAGLPDANTDVTTNVVAGASRTIILPPGTRRIRNLTLGAGVTLQFSPGSILEVEGNMTTNATSSIRMDVANALLVIKGNWTRNNASVVMTGAGSTINFKGAATQVIPPGTYNIISVENLAGASFAINTSVTANDLSISSGASLTLNGGSTLNLLGTLTRSGALTMNATSRLVMAGSSQQVLPNGIYANLVVNNAAGVQVSAGVSISGTLTLTRGIVNTGSGTLVISNGLATAITGQSSVSYIVGKLQRAIQTNTSTYVFPVGNNGLYAPLELINNNLSGVTNLTISLAPKVGNDIGMSVTDAGLVFQRVAPDLVWTLTPNQQPASGSYGVRTYFVNSPTTIALLKDNEFTIVKRSDISTNAADWISGNGVLNPINGLGRKVSDGYALKTGLRSFSQFGIAYMGAAVLSIRLTSFAALRMNDHVKVTWVTENESRNKYFEVERSVNGVDFEVATRVEGAYNSNIRRSYTYADYSAPKGKVYYRLKSVDDMGVADYSKTILLQGDIDVSFSTQVKPNPVSDRFTLTVSDRSILGAEAQIIDMSGIRVMTFALRDMETSVDVSRLKNGVYYLRLIKANGEILAVEKVVVSK
ncbi:MAG: T9SS type A sorting domain-containing protein [Chitinophagaceae bacterium]